MNKYQPFRIYLGGPIANLTYHQVYGYQRLFKQFLKDIATIAEMSIELTVPVPVGDVKFEPDMPTNLVKEDIANIKRADLCLFLHKIRSEIDHVNSPLTGTSTGTCMEQVYAYMFQKQVIVFTDQSEPLSPWTVFHAHKVCTTLLELNQELSARLFNAKMAMGRYSERHIL